MERQLYLKEWRETNRERYKEYYRNYSSVYSQQNKVKVQERKRKNSQNKKIKAIKFMGGCCKDCGLVSEYSSVYDFHHINPNEKEIGLSKLFGNTWEKIEIELNKCVMLCANCHRIRHAKENKNND